MYERLIHPAPDFNLPHPFFSSTIVYLFFFPVTSRMAPTTLYPVPAPERMFSTSHVLLIASKQSSKLHLCHILVYEPFPDLPPKGCQSRLLCCHLLTSHHSLYTLIPQPFRSQVYPFSIRVSMTFGAASYRMIP